MSYKETGQIQVLVIDDDKDIRMFISEFLIAEGFQVFAVDSAEKGLELLPFQTFDVVFVDHHLPGMQGLVFGEYLRKNNPDLQIALVTGNPDPHLQKNSRLKNIIFIEKPFKVQRFLDVIQEYKDRSDRRQEKKEFHAMPDFAPLIAQHFAGLPGSFSLPNLPERFQKLLIRRIRESLGELRLPGRFTEENRVIAFSALLTAQVFSLKLPKMKDGSTPWEAYDQLMKENGKRVEFSISSSQSGEF